jgi:vancomycin resistance protein VanJ
MSGAPPRPARRFARVVVALATVVYLVVLVAYAAAVIFGAERHWVTTVLLYMPHVLALAPLAVLAPLLALVGPRRLLALTALLVAAFVSLVMGLKLPGGAPSPSGGPHLRLLTYNVDSGRQSLPLLVDEVRDAAPDLVVFQETAEGVNSAVAAALPALAHTHSDGQFFVASRYPIVEVQPSALFKLDGADHTGHFVHYLLDTPLGPVEVVNLHPISPREGVENVRGLGFRHELLSGRLWHADGRTLEAGVRLRRAELEAAVAAAHSATHPVIVVGDTNLPADSTLLDLFAGFTDAFTQAGSGFGYTFPAHKRFAWMRIDRVFLGAGLRATHVEVGAGRGSDHHAVWADVEASR